HFLRSPKEVGACTLRARFAGGKATTNNKKDKNFIVLFPAFAVRTSSKEPKSSSVQALYFWDT
ncbi:hypothetical protein, partial [Brachyspira pilosicoli]